MLPTPKPTPKKQAIPVRLRKPILDIVSESKLPIDDLISSIHTNLKSHFYIKEHVQLGDKQKGNVIKGMVLKINSGTDEMINPILPPKLSPDNANILSIFSRPRRTPSRNVLLSFLQSNAKYEVNSANNGQWILTNTTPIKARPSTLVKASESPEKNKNGKRKLENPMHSLKKKQRTILKAGNTQSATHKKAKVKKLSHSPKSGVPPIWAKLLKRFSLEPEVVLVRLDDGSPSAKSCSSTPKVKEHELDAPAACGKENNANNPNKKMKQMTLFDMKPKMVSPDVDKQKVSNKVSKPDKDTSVKANKLPKSGISGNRQKNPHDNPKKNLSSASKQCNDSNNLIDHRSSCTPEKVNCVASSKDPNNFRAGVLQKCAFEQTNAVVANEQVKDNLAIILHRCSPNKLNESLSIAAATNNKPKDFVTSSQRKRALCTTKKTKSSTVSKLVKMAKAGKLPKGAKSSSSVAAGHLQKNIKCIGMEKHKPAGVSIPPTEDVNIRRISFTDFSKTAECLSPKPGAIVKSTKQGTLDGVLAKGIFTKTERVVMPIPIPTLVKTPPGFENEWFGDAAMIVQFLSSFRNILQPDKSIMLATDSLIEAIMKETAGFTYLNNILVCLLKTLVQGCAPEEHVEAGVSLLDVPITIYSASELTRLYLQEIDDGKNLDKTQDRFVQSLNLLSAMEIHQLCPYDKLNILSFLCSNVLTSYTVNKYVIEIQTNAKKLRIEERTHSQAEKKNKIMEMLLEKEKVENQPANEQDPSNFYGSLAVSDTVESKDDLNLATTNRRSSLLKAKEEKMRLQKLKKEQALKENEELKKQKEELKKQKEQNDFKKKLQFHEDECKALRRFKPVGKDREFSRYWIFPNCDPQLVVEKGWWEEMGASDELLKAKNSTLSPKKANLQRLSQKQPNKWYTYETAEEVKSLIKILNTNEGETKLCTRLKKYLSEITGTNKNSKPDVQTTEHENCAIDLMEGFREEIFELQEKLIEAVLCEMKKPEAWIESVDKANTCQEFAQCLLALQEAVYPKFIGGAFRNVNQDKTILNNTKESNKNNLEMWKEMVAECCTLSRLHVLLGMLSACIQWKMSSANTKCKVCRKKGDDVILLCDSCSNGFHLGCLRPRLPRVPRGDWFCPSCKKSREVSEVKSESEEASSSEDNSNQESSDDEDMIESKRKKVVCGKCKRKGDERLMCVACFKGWHPSCHKPPMRNIPRGPWFCTSCRNKKGKMSNRKKK